jgi:DinB family protein
MQKKPSLLLTLHHGEHWEAVQRKVRDFMTDGEVLADFIADLNAGIHQAVTGLSAQELAWQPDAEGNSIGVTVWHISRGFDVLKVRLLEQRQALAEQWHTQGWAQKAGYDPRAIGTGGLGVLTGYTQEEVAAIPQLSAEDLLAYLDQAAEALRCHRESCVAMRRREKVPVLGHEE